MELNFYKYRYLGAVAPEVPETWKPIIFKMIEDIDKIIKPKFISRWFLNFLYDKSHNKRGLVVIPFLDKILSKLIDGTNITQIKQKFATLRVYGTFNSNVCIITRAAESTCNNTCESCGNNGTSNVMVKNWVRNLCLECIEKIKK